MDWKTVYDAFPVNREMIWLNNCGTAPAGKHVVSAITRFINGYAEKGFFTETASYSGLKERIKTLLADLLNCSPDSLALIHNTAEGMNFISHGLRLSHGDELILLENEYPSNVYPWRHWSEKGVRLVFAPMERTPEDFFETLCTRVTLKTRVITLSGVHWCTGMPLPLADIGAFCAERGIELVVDGAQTVGMQPMDMIRMKIPFMSFSAWKWLLGPLGVGILYVAKEKLLSLKPIFIGTESVVRDQEYLPYKEELKPTADRFTFSTGNWNDWVYLLASLEFLSSIGFERVQHRIFELSQRLSEGLSQIGYTVLCQNHPTWPTGIIVCEKEGIPAAKILAHLKKKKIVAAERLGCIRFSPHVYNSPEQMDAVVAVLREIKTY